jgi:hypothetical protein
LRGPIVLTDHRMLEKASPEIIVEEIMQSSHCLS